MTENAIALYQTPDGLIHLEVKVDKEDVWLTINQMAELFGVNKSGVSRHLSNIYRSGELEKSATVAKFATVQHEGERRISRDLLYYNLDAIISVGYRVNSMLGTQFRIWANKVLKDYLIKGYAIQEKLRKEQYGDLLKTLDLVSGIMSHHSLSNDEATGLLRVLSDYSYGLNVLDQYDHQSLEMGETSLSAMSFRATYESAMEAIRHLFEVYGGNDLFGNEKDDSFKSAINVLYQTFDGKELYPSVEEKAAMLLYATVKNHAFSDGNKRIAAFLFLWFLDNNGILYKCDGSHLLANNTMVALTLLIAESRPQEKDMILKVIVNLINRRN